MKIRILTITIAFLSCVLASAAPRFPFRHYSTENGMLSNTVRAIVQDKIGMVWLGTSNGLDSFDGNEFVEHSFALQGENKYVNSLLSDSFGRLWVGTDDALYCYNSDIVFKLGSFVTAIVEDSDHNIWASTRNTGLFKYTQDGKAAHYMDNGDFECIFVDSSGMLWACPNSSDELYVYNRSQDSFNTLRVSYEGCTPSRYRSIVEMTSSDFILGTWDQGLYRFDKNTMTMYPANVLTGAAGMNHIHSMILYAPGELLISSDDGLLWYSTITQETKLYTEDRNDLTTLSNKFAYPILKDVENGIWVGTYYAGLCYSAPNAGQFEQYSMSALVGSQQSFIISSFCEDEDGNVWVGSDNGGLLHFSPSTGKALDYLMPDKNVQDVLQEGDCLWVGSYSGGIDKVNLRNHHIEHVMDGSFYSFFLDRDNVLWAASLSQIYRSNEDRSSFVALKTVGVTVVSIDQTPDGRLWFATEGRGLYSYNPGTDDWREFSVSNSSLPDDYVNHVLALQDGRLFVGTKRGLCMLESGAYNFSSPSVILDDIYYMAYDGTSLWMTSGKGLQRYDLGTGTVVPFNVDNGLFSTQFLSCSGLHASDGRIFVGSTHGFCTFFPQNISQNNFISPILITRFRVHERSRRASGNEEYYTTIAPVDGMKLPYKQNNIQITFSSLSYCAPSKNSYAYKLDGFDSQWNLVGNQTWADYSNLPAGHYTFIVKAANNDGIWNQDGSQISFVVRPPFLRSPFAFVLYLFLIAASLIYSDLLIRKREQRKTQEAYDKLVAERDAEEIISRNKFVTAIAKQIRTPLIQLQSPIDKLMKKDLPEDLREEIETIDKNNQKVLKLVNQMFDASKVPFVACTDTDEKAEDNFVSRLLALIDANISNPDISVDKLATELCVSRSGLFAKVKESTGMTPNQLILNSRMQAAAKLIKEGNNSINEVSFMVGFNSPSYFSKCFLKHFGKTPLEWQRSS